MTLSLTCINLPLDGLTDRRLRLCWNHLGPARAPGGSCLTANLCLLLLLLLLYPFANVTFCH